MILQVHFRFVIINVKHHTSIFELDFRAQGVVLKQPNVGLFNQELLVVLDTKQTVVLYLLKHLRILLFFV